MPHVIPLIDIAPPEVATAPAEFRHQFWSLVVPIALRVKDNELSQGLDATGAPLADISDATRKHRRSAMTPDKKGDPDAPPLMPAYAASRVRSLLAGLAYQDHAELYWRYDPFSGATFDVILDYQVEQGRDVFGISDLGMATIEAQALQAWEAWKQTGVAPAGQKTAFAGPSASATRITATVARSQLPHAKAVRGVGKMTTPKATYGIGIGAAPTGTARTGAMTGADWQRYWTGTKPPTRPVGKAPVPRPPIPKPPVPKPAPAPPTPTADDLLQARMKAAQDRIAGYGFESEIMTPAEMASRLGLSDVLVDTAPGAFSRTTGKVYLNIGQSHWADPAADAAANAKSGWWASAQETYVVDHESGHALHYTQDPAAFVAISKMTQTEFSFQEYAVIQSQVSRYAATKPVELVAEVFAGTVGGKTYSPEVMAIYNRFGGPPLPGTIP